MPEVADGMQRATQAVALSVLRGALSARRGLHPRPPRGRGPGCKAAMRANDASLELDTLTLRFHGLLVVQAGNKARLQLNRGGGGTRARPRCLTSR